MGSGISAGDHFDRELQTTPGLLDKDGGAHDLEWIEKNAPEESFVAFRRTNGKNENLAYFHNFSVSSPQTYTVALTKPGTFAIDEVFNSNEERFGGDGTCRNREILIEIDAENEISYIIRVAPLSSVVIREAQKM